MSKIGHVLAAPEQAIVVFNGYMKPLDVSSMLKPKKIQKSKSPIWHILDSNRANQPLCHPKNYILVQCDESICVGKERMLLPSIHSKVFKMGTR